MEGAERGGHDAGSRHHAEGRGSACGADAVAAPAAAAPAEPEVIKKGKEEETEEEK